MSQECKIKMAVGNLSMNTVKLLADEVKNIIQPAHEARRPALGLLLANWKIF